jgi:hypothetical protein
MRLTCGNYSCQRFDAEHSYILAGGWTRALANIRYGSPSSHTKACANRTPESQSTLYTYAASRPLRAVYFDGFSAAKSYDGTFDMQDVLLYGKADGWPNQGVYDDLERAILLCEWGTQFGIEGFVREEAGFEVIFNEFISL